MKTKKIFFSLLGIITILVMVLVINWINLDKNTPKNKAIENIFSNNTQISETLSLLIQSKTTSNEDPSKVDTDEFQQVQDMLRQRFPKTHNTLEIQEFGQQALLYYWQGSNKALKPAMLSAHYDVVPVEEGQWKQPPFSGAMDKNYIWGRGTLDDKSAIVAILHATETLITQGHQPERTIIFAFGGDEEVGGKQGAQKISDYLASKNTQVEFILDEGMPIADGIMKGIDKPVAMIGIAEKGFANVTLSATQNDGHSSTPPTQTAVGILSEAITKIEANPMPVNFSGPIGLLFDKIARNMKPLQGIVVSNRWLFGPLLGIQLSNKTSTNALIRTTMAATMIQGSQQANVLPKTAKATLNVRILPGDNSTSVLKHIEQTVNDPRVKIAISGISVEPSIISDVDTKGYLAISKSIEQTVSNVIVAPSLLIASTDSKHYARLTKNIYRFRPLWIKSEDIARFHGTNERIGRDNLNQMTMFYYQLLINSSS